MRLSYSEIKEKYGVDDIWSWSRFHTYETSQFEYFLKYIVKKNPDNNNSAYAPYGGACHNILEDFYNGKIEYKNMAEKFRDESFLLDIGEFKFDRTNETKNSSIKEKYLKDIEHFFNNHQKIQGKYVLEQFIPIKIGEYFFQGYIDMLRKDNDGNYIIQDWKTSSLYIGSKAISEAGQLILYAIGLNQTGVPLEKIKCCWNFLKYANVTVMQSNGKAKVRQIERCVIGSSIKSSVAMWLKKLGYSEAEKEQYLENLIQSNDINVLPDDVKEKFKIEDCYVYVDYSKKHIDEITSRILTTMSEIKAKTDEYQISKDDKIFYEDETKVKKQSFYFANLCGYSANLHKPYKIFLNNNTNFTISDTNKSNNKDNKEEFSGELSWLNDI